MSGFVGRVGEKTGEYDLTATKALYWHRRRSCCTSAEQIIDRHVRPDFAVEHRGNVWRITGQGLDQGYTDDLYAAVSGVTETFLPRYEAQRRWKW